MLPDGRIVTAGWKSVDVGGVQEAITIVRFLADGTRDSAFGDDGVFIDLTAAVTAVPETTRVEAVTVDACGRLVVAGYSVGGEATIDGPAVLVVRYQGFPVEP